jgi:anti-sigma28 factor (negative regulator of flagellin synthesis)
MKAEIVTRVAEVLRNPVAAKREKNVAEKSSSDTVELSANANRHISKMQSQESELEKEQYLKVQGIKERYERGNYHLTKDMIDTIADKIVAMF